MNRDGEIRANDAQRALLKSAGSLDEAEVEVSNLSAPDTVTAGDRIDVVADLENLGNEGAFQNISVRAATEGDPLDENATLDEKFVDMAVAGVTNPVDREAQTTIVFNNVTANLDPGNYTLGVFSDDDSETGTITVEAGGGTITGDLTLDQSAPSDVDVTVTADDGNGTTYSETVTIAESDTTTTYTLANVDENTGSGYTVTATATNYTDAEATNVTVTADSTTQQDFTLDRLTGDLAGTVTNDTGSAIQGATIDVYAFQSDDSGSPTVSDTTDGNGDYGISDLPVGSHYLTVTVDGSVVGSATVSIADNATTTQDFSFTEASFDVSFQTASNTTAGSTHEFDVDVSNTGELPGTQNVSLDWGSGTYSDQAQVPVEGGQTVTETLSVSLSNSQPIDFYDVTLSSEDSSKTTTIAVAPERSVLDGPGSPDGTVTVAVTGEVASTNDLDLVEAWSPDANDSTIIDSSFDLEEPPSGGTADSVFAVGTDAAPGALNVTYEIEIPSDAGGTTFEWNQLDSDDRQVLLRIGGTGGKVFPILGDQQFDVSSGGTTVGAVTTDYGTPTPA